VNTLLQQEIDKGIAPGRIVVAGFSQGGALAFHTALRSAHTLGGIVALSTWVPLREDYPASFSSAMRTVPILQVCITTPEIYSFALSCCALWLLYID